MRIGAPRDEARRRSARSSRRCAPSPWAFSRTRAARRCLTRRLARWSRTSSATWSARRGLTVRRGDAHRAARAPRGRGLRRRRARRRTARGRLLGARRVGVALLTRSPPRAAAAAGRRGRRGARGARAHARLGALLRGLGRDAPLAAAVARLGAGAPGALEPRSRAHACARAPHCSNLLGTVGDVAGAALRARGGRARRRRRRRRRRVRAAPARRRRRARRRLLRVEQLQGAGPARGRALWPRGLVGANRRRGAEPCARRLRGLRVGARRRAARARGGHMRRPRCLRWLGGAAARPTALANGTADVAPRARHVLRRRRPSARGRAAAGARRSSRLRASARAAALSACARVSRDQARRLGARARRRGGVDAGARLPIVSFTHATRAAPEIVARAHAARIAMQRRRTRARCSAVAIGGSVGDLARTPHRGGGRRHRRDEPTAQLRVGHGKAAPRHAATVARAGAAARLPAFERGAWARSATSSCRAAPGAVASRCCLSSRAHAPSPESGGWSATRCASSSSDGPSPTSPCSPGRSDERRARGCGGGASAGRRAGGGGARRALSRARSRAACRRARRRRRSRARRAACVRAGNAPGSRRRSASRSPRRWPRRPGAAGTRRARSARSPPGAVVERVLSRVRHLVRRRVVGRPRDERAVRRAQRRRARPRRSRRSRRRAELARGRAPSDGASRSLAAAAASSCARGRGGGRRDADVVARGARDEPEPVLGRADAAARLPVTAAVVVSGARLDELSRDGRPPAAGETHGCRNRAASNCGDASAPAPATRATPRAASGAAARGRARARSS